MSIPAAAFSASTGTSPPTSLAAHAHEVLRHRLVMLDIAPGDAINEAELGAELDLGRTPIREALKRLEADHLVVSFPRRGTFAANVDFTELAAISEMREALEPIAARRAAANLTPEMRTEFAEAVQRLRALDPAEPARELMEVDLEVHRLVYRAVENLHLQETLTRLDDLATRIWCLVLPRIPDLLGHIREHIDFLEAVLAGDVERAENMARDHVHEFEATVRSALATT